MTRKRYIVAYDIANPKRLRLVAKTLKGYGYRLQFSVFECLLDPLRKEKAKNQLSEIIHHTEDQILFIVLGSGSSDSSFIIEAIGMPYIEHSRVTIV